MRGIFVKGSPFNKRAKTIAWIWTLLVFIACLIPSNEIPRINIPLADKWVHFLLFGAFSFFWLSSKLSLSTGFLSAIFFISVLYGWFIEALQGFLPSLGRSYDTMDVVADGIGGLLGILFYYYCYRFFEDRKP